MELTGALNVPGSGQRPRLDRVAGLLVGTRCGTCGTDSWPGRVVCQGCGRATMAEHRFSATGMLLTHTEVWTPRPGLTIPYRLGQVRLDDGPVVFGHVRDLPLKAQVPVAVVLAVSKDENAIPPFWFVSDTTLDTAR